MIAVAPSGLDHFSWFVPKAHKSLALGLTLIATPQLVSKKQIAREIEAGASVSRALRYQKRSLLRHTIETLLIDLLNRDGDGG